VVQVRPPADQRPRRAAADLREVQKIRDEADQWSSIGAYVAKHVYVTFTHSMCPVCAQDFLSQLDRLIPRK
jgi:hypothetical protein